MKVKNIVTMDEELTFLDVEILNCKNKRELDKAISNNKILMIMDKRRNIQFELDIHYILSIMKEGVKNVRIKHYILYYIF